MKYLSASVWLKIVYRVSKFEISCSSLSSTHDTCADSNAADARANYDEEPHDNSVVDVDEVTGIPGVKASIYTSIISSDIVTRASVSNVSVSEDESSNEPGKTTASERTTNEVGKFDPGFTFSGGIKKLEDCYDHGTNIDDESPVKPCDELSGNVLVSSLFSGAWHVVTSDSPA